MTTHTPDFAVIGAGSAGLTFAAGAAQLGFDVVLIEASQMGGDCLNVGCVPSKALLAAAGKAGTHIGSADLGIRMDPPHVTFKSVMQHVHAAIDAIAPHDSQERFEGLGVTVLRDEARFIDAHTLSVGFDRVKAKRFIIATGSRPKVPAVPGLEGVDYLTNETLWDVRTQPERLLILGGGAIGTELGQAFARFGTDVTLLEAGGYFSREEPEAAEALRAALTASGVTIHDHAKVARAEALAAGGGRLILEDDQEFTGDAVLVAAGRAPSTDTLDLDKAGVRLSDSGAVDVDAGLRTSQNHIFAIGDCRGGPQFTHMAGDDGAILLRRLVFKALWSKARDELCPRCIYTDPEFAALGLTEAQARERHGSAVRVVQVPFEGNDRAVAEADTNGFVKAVLGKGGRILGVTIVGRHAGDLLFPVSQAVATGQRIRAFTSVLAPYPTRSEALKRVASRYYEPAVFSRTTKRLVSLLSKLPI